MVNPPLLFASALFFLAVSALLYVVAWLLIKTVLRIPGRLSPHRIRGLLSAALILPPIFACAFTAGGAFLRHSHTSGALHHNVFCGEIAQFLAMPEGKLPVLLGLAVQGAAWASLRGSRVCDAQSMTSGALPLRHWLHWLAVACGSVSTISETWPAAWPAPARWIARVVFPAPPFWLIIAIVGMFAPLHVHMFTCGR